MKVHFSEQELSGGRFPDSGTFLVRISAVTMATSGSGNQKIVFDVDGTGEMKGAKHQDHIALVQATKYRLRDILLAAGFTRDELKSGVDPREAMGRFVKQTRRAEGMKTFTKRDGSQGETADVKVSYSKATAEEIAAIDPGGDELSLGSANFDDDISL